jgi:hypothetical protein
MCTAVSGCTGVEARWFRWQGGMHAVVAPFEQKQFPTTVVQIEPGPVTAVQSAFAVQSVQMPSCTAPQIVTLPAPVWHRQSFETISEHMC